MCVVLEMAFLKKSFDLVFVPTLPHPRLVSSQTSSNVAVSLLTEGCAYLENYVSGELIYGGILFFELQGSLQFVP